MAFVGLLGADCATRLNSENSPCSSSSSSSTWMKVFRTASRRDCEAAGLGEADGVGDTVGLGDAVGFGEAVGLGVLGASLRTGETGGHKRGEAQATSARESSSAHVTFRCAFSGGWMRAHVGLVGADFAHRLNNENACNSAVSLSSSSSMCMKVFLTARRLLRKSASTRLDGVFPPRQIRANGEAAASTAPSGSIGLMPSMLGSSADARTFPSNPSSYQTT